MDLEQQRWKTVIHHSLFYFSKKCRRSTPYAAQSQYKSQHNSQHNSPHSNTTEVANTVSLSGSTTNTSNCSDNSFVDIHEKDMIFNLSLTHLAEPANNRGHHIEYNL